MVRCGGVTPEISFEILSFRLSSRPTRPGAEIGRQACLRGMCPIGCEGSSPSPGTLTIINPREDP